MIAIGLPWRLLNRAKILFPNATFPSELNTKLQNRKIFEDCEFGIILIDTLALRPDKSLGTKLEYRYLMRSNKLLCLMLNDIVVNPHYLENKLKAADLPTDEEYLNDEDPRQ